ncbi:MAG TPA: hypothetical protein VFI48_06070 [Hyphomicrobiaceae bacterium]|nr:hypothetical protein [Hyphomicrobiaceae bacterium]
MSKSGGSLAAVKNELLPGLRSPSWHLREPWIVVDEVTERLLVMDGPEEVGFVITAAEVADGSYRKKFFPQMRAWMERRAAGC